MLQRRLGRVFARPTLLRLHETSGGNPFYALELARALGPDVDPTQPLAVPESLEVSSARACATCRTETRDASVARLRPWQAAARRLDGDGSSRRSRTG